MSTKVTLNRKFGIVQCMELLICGYFCEKSDNPRRMCSDILDIILMFFGGFSNWKLCDNHLTAFLNTSKIHLMSKPFMCKGLEFVSHLIQDKFIGFYYSITTFPTNHEIIQVKYQLQCKQTNTFWHFRSILCSKEIIETDDIAPYDGCGWPYSCTLQTCDIPVNITHLNFTCFIIDWNPMDWKELDRESGAADRYWLKTYHIS
eukprot:UN01258